MKKYGNIIYLVLILIAGIIFIMPQPGAESATDAAPEASNPFGIPDLAWYAIAGVTLIVPLWVSMQLQKKQREEFESEAEEEPDDELQ